MRRFQQAQNHKNPITGCGEIDRRRSTSHIYKIGFGYFLYVRRRSLTIDFSAASDRIFMILGLLESSHRGESDSGVSFDCISQKHIDKLGITYHDKSNSIEIPDASYSILEKVNLYITFNNDKKHKSIPSEFIVIRSD